MNRKRKTLETRAEVEHVVREACLASARLDEVVARMNEAVALAKEPFEAEIASLKAGYDALEEIALERTEEGYDLAKGAPRGVRDGQERGDGARNDRVPLGAAFAEDAQGGDLGYRAESASRHDAGLCAQDGGGGQGGAHCGAQRSWG